MIRRSCALSAVFVVLLSGSTGGHMLLVEHTRCAEHGELVHGAGPHHHAATVAPRGEHDGDALEQSTGRSSGGAHEHCALTVDRRDAPARVADSPSARPASNDTPTFSPGDAFVLVDPKRFRTAPKHSPPA